MPIGAIWLVECTRHTHYLSSALDKRTACRVHLTKALLVECTQQTRCVSSALDKRSAFRVHLTNAPLSCRVHSTDAPLSCRVHSTDALLVDCTRQRPHHFNYYAQPNKSPWICPWGQIHIISHHLSSSGCCAVPIRGTVG